MTIVTVMTTIYLPGKRIVTTVIIVTRRLFGAGKPSQNTYLNLQKIRSNFGIDFAENENLIQRRQILVCFEMLHRTGLKQSGTKRRPKRGCMILTAASPVSAVWLRKYDDMTVGAVWTPGSREQMGGVNMLE